MKETPEQASLRWILDTYFSDPERTIPLSKGEVLMEQGARNERLFVVKSGLINGYVTSPSGKRYELFSASEDHFVGVLSFFSRNFRAASTVIAEEDSEVAFITAEREGILAKDGISLFAQLMPIVMSDLSYRNTRELESAAEKELTLRKLVRTEKLASLGQMSAGLAHELNNAIAALSRGTEWLSERLEEKFCEKHPDKVEFYRTGLQEGRCVPTREIRKRTKVLVKKGKLEDSQAKKLAEIGLSEERLLELAEHMDVDSVHRYWDLGATCHGMLVAARHATHVVGSVKALGSPHSEPDAEVDITKTLEEALALLSSPLRVVTVYRNFSELPMVRANRGELIQVWSNLIKNAHEAMLTAEVESPELLVSSEVCGEKVFISIQDNGPGIPENVAATIFQPDVSTKTKGLKFGLGLGLAIVDRIIGNYGGTISVKSQPGKTVFKVELPVGSAEHGKA